MCAQCTVCGIIQHIELSTGTAHMSVSSLTTGYRHVVHRYSRVVYFRSFLMSLQGETTPVIPSEDEQRMRHILDGYNLINANIVRQVLKKLKLLTRYRRHVESLAVKFSKGQYKPLQIQPDMMRDILRLFRRVECFWDHGGKQQDLARKRRVFLSYPYVYYQICYHLNALHLADEKFLLKSDALLEKLHLMYAPVAEKAGLDYDVNCSRNA